ncbi:MAG: ATP synthase F1 subunit epsilon [Bacteroidetes bacterium]|nr:MAG: ATP synthase F1 subunit epsilon [Bacteroidota bacterium]
MKLDILTPDQKIYSGEVSLVQLPGVDGLFEILNNHAPMIAALGKGRIKIESNQANTEFIEIDGGMLEVKDNHVLVLAEEVIE